MEFIEFKNIYDMLTRTVNQYGDTPAFKWFIDDDRADQVTWNAFYEQVRQAAKSLIHLGIQKDDKVTILSYSNYRWVLTDCAVTSIGACTVGIYHSNLAHDCQYIIEHSDSVLVFAEDDTQLAKLMQIREQIPAVRQVILLKGEPPADTPWVMSYEQFMALGDQVDDAQFDRMAASVTPQDVAGIVYTSGTTGVPKGAMLTHDNICFTAQSVHGSVNIKDGDDVFLFLPLAHVFARTCTFTAMLVGSTTTFTRSIDTLADDLKRAQPHWFASVPRIYEKIYAKIRNGVVEKGGVTRKLFDWAMGIGKQVGECRLNKQPLPVLLAFQHKIANKLIFEKIQAAFGGKLRWCISGAAPLDPAIAEFFHAVGILVLEGLGMTENTSFSHVNRYDNYRFGWVGQPGPGIEQRIDDTGELLVHGRNVMKGYYKMPEATASDITADGWLHTGDLGQIDDEGFLKITGRAKDIIITAGGKNIAPARIEAVICESRYINQVFIIGDRQKFLSALLTIDIETVPAYAQKQGIAFSHIDELITHDQIKALVQAEIDTANAKLPSYETIKTFSLVPEFTIQNGLLTPTMKIKKNKVAQAHQQAIASLYPSA